ncbi:MAG: metal ABC transporter ATP-binding protein, partial [Odoribacter sp.]|nr:metal ABC transporter ATP-binding protein [Odoribacter sp.]
MDTILELKHVSAGYDGSPVLEDVSLQVHEKDFIGVIGPNGGGKTTLLKIILGLLKPEKGEVVYHRSKHNLFGYLPQNNRFDRNFPINVTEVVLSGLLSEKGLTGRYTREDRKKAKMLLEKYGMGRYLNTPIGELSGGQMQRVFLCRAIVSSPQLLILDEPTTYVDCDFEKELYNIL